MDTDGTGAVMWRFTL